MNGIDLSVRIQVRCLSRREEHESLVTREEAVDVIVEIVMLGRKSVILTRSGV